MERSMRRLALGCVLAAFFATSTWAQEAPLRPRLDGFGVQVHKIVNGADWLVELLYGSNAVTGIVRQPDGHSDFLLCLRSGWDDREMTFACYVAPSEASPSAPDAAAPAGFTGLPGYEAIEGDVVVPADFFFRNEGPEELRHFPPGLERFGVGPAEGSPAVPAIALDWSDGTSAHYVVDGGIETRDDGTLALPMIEQESDAPAVLSTTRAPDGNGVGRFDYRLVVSGEEECRFALFNVADSPIVATTRHIVLGRDLVVAPDPDGGCSDPFGPSRPNPATTNLVGRAHFALPGSSTAGAASVTSPATR